MTTFKYPLIAPIGSAMGINLIKAKAHDAIFNAEVHSDAVLAFINHFPETDIAFTIMDTSVEARALGCEYEMKGRVPAIRTHEFTSSDELASLEVVEPESNKPMLTNIDAVKIISSNISKPLATYVVGPVTLGAHLFGITNLIKLSRKNTEEFERILNFTSATIKRYACALRGAGAAYIIILEPQAVIFSPKFYNDTIKKHVEDIAETLEKTILHICGDTSRHVADFAATDYIDSLSLDWQVDFGMVKDHSLNGDKLLLGNIDPVEKLQKGSPEVIQKSVIELLESMKGTNFILSTGCDMVPETPIENLNVFIETALHWRREYAIDESI